jgi:putative acyl-CoA dehydrogenase
MREVLADLCVESAAATALFVRLARTVDDDERALARLTVPAAKFWVCKRTVTVVGEALECLGGNGYVEDSGLPRLYRESPLNSIWEGSGNVIALDVVRAATREPASVAALLAELATTAGADRALDGAVAQLTSRLAGLGQDPGADQRGARQLSEWLARCLAGSLLVRHAPGLAGRFLAGLTEPSAALGARPGPGTDIALRAIPET